MLIVGAGRLARAFLPALRRAGHPVLAMGRADPGPALSRAALVLLAVPDRAIAEVARSLAADPRGRPWRGRVVLHHAGALGVEPLAPLGRRGAATGVLHPLQVLGDGRRAADVLAGSAARIEGDPTARRAARRLALELGLRPLPLPVRLTPAQRIGYHTAASLASNDLVALLALALHLLEDAGVGGAAARSALAVLARGALLQIEQGSVEAALTGPAVRGDAATLRGQLGRLRRSSAAGARAHAALSRVLADLAAEHGLLSASGRREVLRVLGGPARVRPL